MIRERSQRRDRYFTSTTAEEHIRRGKNKRISSSRCRKNTRQRGHKRETKREKAFFVPSAWLGARTAFQPTLLRVRFFCSTEKEQE